MAASKDEPSRVDTFPVAPDEFGAGGLAWLQQTVHELAIAGDPLLQQLPRTSIPEAPRPVPNQELKLTAGGGVYRPVVVTTELIVNIDEVVAFDRDALLAQLLTVSDDMAAQQVKAMLQLMSDVTEQTGNVVSMDGGSIYGGLLQAVEQMEVSFVNEGKHSVGLVLHPDLVEWMKENPPGADFHRAMEELLARKKDEYFAKRNRRDLPS